jgi:hypothetical protein
MDSGTPSRASSSCAGVARGGAGAARPRVDRADAAIQPPHPRRRHGLLAGLAAGRAGGRRGWGEKKSPGVTGASKSGKRDLNHIGAVRLTRRRRTRIDGKPWRPAGSSAVLRPRTCSLVLARTRDFLRRRVGGTAVDRVSFSERKRRRLRLVRYQVVHGAPRGRKSAVLTLGQERSQQVVLTTAKIKRHRQQHGGLVGSGPVLHDMNSTRRRVLSSERTRSSAGVVYAQVARQGEPGPRRLMRARPDDMRIGG